jgi:hypothetical protein
MFYFMLLKSWNDMMVKILMDVCINVYSVYMHQCIMYP